MENETFHIDRNRLTPNIELEYTHAHDQCDIHFLVAANTYHTDEMGNISLS